LFVNIATKGKTTQVAQLDLYDLFLLGTKAKPPVLVLQLNKNEVPKRYNFWKTLPKNEGIFHFLMEEEYPGICDENRSLTFVMFPFDLV